MLERAQTKISDKGRLVIPAEFREALGIKVGDVVSLEIVDHELRISTFSARLKATQERLKKYATPGKLMSDELIEGRRSEARQEEAEFQAWKNAHGEHLQAKA